MGCRLLNTNHSSLSFKSSNSLFPSPNRALFPPNSLSFPFRFKSPQGSNICRVLRWPIIAASAHKFGAPLWTVDKDDFPQVCKTCSTVKEEPLSCPLGWWKGHENEDISQIFEDWCKEYGKTYLSNKEKLRRFKLFKYSYAYFRQYKEFIDDSYDTMHEVFDVLGMQNKVECSAKDGRVIFCDTIETWNEQLGKGQVNGKLFVVDFTAEWCQPCKMMLPILHDLAEKMPEVTFLEVDVVGAELKTVAEKLGVEAIPTFMLMKNGEVVDKVVGIARNELRFKIARQAIVGEFA